MADRSVAEWREQYRRELVEIDAIELSGDPGARRHNRRVNRMQHAHLVLRTSPEGRAAISALIEDPVPTVAVWAATQALFWDESRARARLERFVEANDVYAFEAQITLRECHAGRLRTDWPPNAN